MIDIITVEYDSPNVVMFVSESDHVVMVSEHARTVTLLVELDYLKRYPHTVVLSSREGLFTLVEQRVVLAHDELKLQLTYAHRPSLAPKRQP